MNNDKNVNDTANRQDEPRRKMARLPTIAGIVTATGVGSIALLGSFFFPDYQHFLIPSAQLILFGFVFYYGFQILACCKRIQKICKETEALVNNRRGGNCRDNKDNNG